MDLTNAMVKQFSANLYMLAQQKGSRLRGLVSNETLTGEKKFFTRMGSTIAVRKTGRNEDSPIIETALDNRMIVPKDYHWGDMVDTMEKLKTLTDPSGKLSMSGSYALGRAMDDEIISAMTGTAYSGKDGTTPVVLPAAQKIALTVGSTGANVGLNVGKLIAAKSKFGKADLDLDDPENALYLAVSQSQLDDLLAITQVTSSDYNSVKALVEGKVDTFMGFKFVRTERLAKVDTGSNTNTRSCIAWLKSGVVLALPQDITTEAAKRADKCFNPYVYASMSISAGRLEDNKVVEILCEEAD